MPLRVQPQQQRSKAQLAAIEKAARSILHTVGRDRFTTGQVAAAAGVSIGTIYRYFPDKVAILDQVWPERRDDKMSKVAGDFKG